ncbi:MAG: ABC transporter ATP-binding protein [Defluviitaleaceae bacterium]|nr:ABC transporter ATP-binding protein [Defluviitaleaceae bacterium]
MANVLQLKDLSKSYGKTRVLDGISLDVPEGSLYGFIGANGAGKTTTMKIILGLLKNDGGEVSVCGEKVIFGKTATNKNVGYLPDVPEFYPYMRPAEYLLFCGRAAGLSTQVVEKRSAELLETVGLYKANKKIGAFSRGMKQRLGVAQALINEPRLLICDEPTSALDPLGRKEILDILRKIKGRTTVVFSTHILSDVERICDRAAMLSNGKIVIDGTLQELSTRRRTNSIRIEFENPRDAALFNLNLPPELKSEGESTEIERIISARDLAFAKRAVMRLLLEQDIMPVKIETLEASVEDIFLEAAV